MPLPSSATHMSVRPPSCTVTSTVVAPASSAFSTSSLTTDAGRSTTSPAAIWSATAPGRMEIVGTQKTTASGYLRAVVLPVLTPRSLRHAPPGLVSLHVLLLLRGGVEDAAGLIHVQAVGGARRDGRLALRRLRLGR